MGRAKEVKSLEEARVAGEDLTKDITVKKVFDVIAQAYPQVKLEQTEIGSTIFCSKNSEMATAREQAASCQREILGGLANIAREYATKRYRSNLINWECCHLFCRFRKEKGSAI